MIRGAQIENYRGIRARLLQTIASRRPPRQYQGPLITDSRPGVGLLSFVLSVDSGTTWRATELGCSPSFQNRIYVSRKCFELHTAYQILAEDLVNPVPDPDPLLHHVQYMGGQ
jgi:hypothetical protein